MAKKSSSGKLENNTSGVKPESQLKAEDQIAIKRAKKAAQRQHPANKHSLAGGNLANHLAFASYRNDKTAQQSTTSAQTAAAMARVAHVTRSA